MADAKLIITAEDRTKAAFRSISGSFAGLQATAQRLTGLFAGVGGVLSAGAFVGLVKGSLDAAARLDDLAESTGGTVEGLSALQRVAEISGTDIDSVAGASVKLTRALSDLGGEGGKAAAEALKAIGLEAGT
jgi:hypothetical protein